MAQFFKYGMRLRGFSIGCQPFKGLIDVTDDPSKKYHDILIYSRELTGKEVEDYELDLLEVENEAHCAR